MTDPFSSNRSCQLINQSLVYSNEWQTAAIEYNRQ